MKRSDIMSNMYNSFNNMIAFSQQLLSKNVATGSSIEVDEELLNTLDTISQNLIWCKGLIYIIVLSIFVFAVFCFYYFILSRFLYDNDVHVLSGTIDTTDIVK